MPFDDLSGGSLACCRIYWFMYCFFNFDLVRKSDKAKCRSHPFHLLFFHLSDAALYFLSMPPFSTLTVLTLVTHINIWFGSWLCRLGKSAVLMYHFVSDFRVCICVCVPVKHSYVHQIHTQGLWVTEDMVYSCLREASCQAAWSYNSPEQSITVMSCTLTLVWISAPTF